MKRNLYFLAGAFLVAALCCCSYFCYSYFYPKQYVKDENGEYINVNTPQKETFPITDKTKFVIEYFYPDEHRTLTENIDTIPALIGCNLEETKNYLSQYMEHLPTQEQLDGLTSYELISYEGLEIHLRKTYHQTRNGGYIAKSFNGMVVILNGDGKTVYEYTEINIGALPEDLRNEILDGMKLETEEELYSFLENYSS